MLNGSFFVDALSDNPAAIPLRAEALIMASAAPQAVVACGDLELERYAQLQLCTASVKPSPRPSCYRYWGGEEYDRLYTSYEEVLWEISWNDHYLHVVQLGWSTNCGSDSRNWVIADSVDIADQFILDIHRKTHAPGEAILVFSDGRWNRSPSLYAATQAASFDDLVLADDMKESIRNDFKQFLSSEDRYRRLGVSWRRGALMIGPPGNGKTHCVRALVKELGISSLYVQSLSHQYLTPQQMWQRVFERARGLTPCVLVLEDSDTLVDDTNRSFFLNQLDGFEQNHGLIVLATTNYPERIDSAIIDRPSRFDRKYHFHLPSQAERQAYLEGWQKSLAEETGWRSEEVGHVAAATDGYSFAYLKELVISSVMKWMADSATSFLDVLLEQSAALGKQMKTEEKPVATGVASAPHWQSA